MERRGPGRWKRTFERTADIRSGSAVVGQDKNGAAGDDYLQQSFLRMKMDFNTRRKKLPMELALMDMISDIIYN